MRSLDYLPNHPEIKLYQDDTMIRINTDTQMLGEFIEVYRNDNVLDIGTNQGALLLYANMFNPKSLTGIDVNSEALELARENMELNNIKNYTLINKSILEYYPEVLYDVVICNPPYFKTMEDNKSQNDYLNLAKHEGELTLKNLTKAISTCLHDNGVLYFLFLSSRLDEVMYELNRNHLTPKVLKMVYDTNKKYSNIFMVKCIKNSKSGMVIEKPVIINR